MRFAHIVTVIILTIVTVSSVIHLISSALVCRKVCEPVVVYFCILVASVSSIYILHNRFVKLHK